MILRGGGSGHDIALSARQRKRGSDPSVPRFLFPRLLHFSSIRTLELAMFARCQLGALVHSVLFIDPLGASELHSKIPGNTTKLMYYAEIFVREASIQRAIQTVHNDMAAGW